MSKFQTVMPSTPSIPPLTIPTWLNVATSCLTCLVPVCVMSMYSAGKLRCNTGMRILIWSLVAATSTTLAWYFGAGVYRRHFE